MPARNARIWQYLAFTGVVLITPFFFVGGPGWADGPLYKSAWNLGHILFFTLLTLAVQPWRIWAGWTLWGVSTVAVLMLGVSIEVLQYGFNRQVDWQDILRNLLGVWAVLAARPQAGHSPVALWSLRILVAVLLITEINATTAVAIRQYRVSQLLPELYDFSQPDPSPFWNGVVTPADAAASEQSGLRLSLTTARYSGASLHNFPGDWQGYDQLVISLYNPDDRPLSLTLRINDLEHDQGDNAYTDRFNTRLTLAPGLNNFHLDLERIRKAPADRTMNMQEIRRLMLFTAGLTEPRTVYLRVIRLE
ncbi:succinyl-CoA synthetase subunit beta [Marinobacter sp. TBZ242]|uniref:Succinyl-CoA synthetase subunit beta n=1 Tax=Marinobacter azerbaijanicus TaxID=3050455 RepID=A0ABT7IGD1_9GAMM|nr:succinyl-CoA synthetase subunit beta [Marinobacter sp. TBZ242]MDL0432213.1 succinyl-CoA synthetase subunit beta [Marinobacter sp. TBZ242]